MNIMVRYIRFILWQSFIQVGNSKGMSLTDRRRRDGMADGKVAPFNMNGKPSPAAHITTGGALVIMMKALGLVLF